MDVGTSRIAASIASVDAEGNIETTRFALGRQADSAPSAVFVCDEDLLFGEAAERRGLAQPERLIREFKRRIGDDVPVVAAGHRYAPEDLFARTVTWVVEAVAERQGTHPEAIIVTVPVAWGDYRRSLVTAALARESECRVELVSEPVAAAWHYESASPLPPGKVLAVYDLGGGTFDVALVGKDVDELRIIGTPTGIGDFGGADFDDLVLRTTVAAAGLTADELASDAGARVGLASLRRECIEAKEALSFDSEAAIPVLVAGSASSVRITRSEFEDLIGAGIERTIDVLHDSLETYDIGDRLDAILLTGGSSRIPRVAQLLSERFDVRIAVDADPKAIVALGASRVLIDRLTRTPGELVGLEDGAAAASALVVADAARPAASAHAAAGSSATSEPKRRRWFQRLPATTAMAGGALVLASGMVLLSSSTLGSASRIGLDTPAYADPRQAAPGTGQAVEAAASEQGPTAPEDEAVEPETRVANPRVDAPKKPAPDDRAPGTSVAPRAGNQVPAPGTTSPSANGDGGSAADGNGSSTSTSPEPDPTTDPASVADPAPVPSTDPDPGPTTDPEPAPAADPEPAPTPDPDPQPEPEPQPQPDPEPQPEPEPQTQPQPQPTPDPTPPSLPDPQ
ncbi:Hsp70 family protein [Microbacterium kyungheense]